MPHNLHASKFENTFERVGGAKKKQQQEAQQGGCPLHK
jgi:hypothetical protein